MWVCKRCHKQVITKPIIHWTGYLMHVCNNKVGFLEWVDKKPNEEHMKEVQY